MDKLTLAHDWAMKHGDKCYPNLTAEQAWDYADAMFEEAEKREKEDAAKKRAEIREILNSNNTFVEREGQHFDDVNWQPDWSLAPDWAEAWAMDSDGICSWFRSSKHIACGDEVWYGTYLERAPNFNYTGDWRDSLRIRPSSK